MSLNVLCERLGVEVEHQLLETALTHRSYSYEHGNVPNNERLEFLGDSVLGFVVTEHIYRLLPDLDEGELTKVKNAVVSVYALAEVANKIGIGEFLKLGKGEEQTGGRSKMNLLADGFEAVIGAVLISNGLPAATALIEKFIFPLLADTDSLRANSDPKTTLQELLQAKGKGALYYSVTHEGPDHDRTFYAEAIFGEKVLGSGTARSKKLAETEAAIAAVEQIKATTKKKK